MRILRVMAVGISVFGAASGYADSSTSCEGRLHPFRVCDAFEGRKEPSLSCGLHESSLATIKSAAGATMDEDILGRARAKRLNQLEVNKSFALKTLQCTLTLQSSATNSAQKGECERNRQALKSRLHLLIPRMRQALYLSGKTTKIKHSVTGSVSIPPITTDEKAQAEARLQRTLQALGARESGFAKSVRSAGQADKIQLAYADEYESLLAQAPFLVYFSGKSLDEEGSEAALTDAFSKWYVQLESERRRTLEIQGDQRLALLRDRSLINETLLETRPSLTKEACDQAKKLLARAEADSRQQEILSFGVAAGGAGLCALFPPSCVIGVSSTGVASSYVHLSETQDRYQNVFAQFLTGTGCRGDLRRASDDRDLAIAMIPLSVSGVGSGAARGAVKAQAGAWRGEAERLIERSHLAVSGSANVDELSQAVNLMKREVDGAVVKMTDKEIYDYLSGWVKSQNEGTKYLPGLSKETSPQSFDEMLKNIEIGAGGKDQIGAVSRTLYNNTAAVDQFETFATMLDVETLKGLLPREAFESAVPGRVFQEFTKRVADESWAWDSLPVSISADKVKQGLSSWYDPGLAVWH